ncbi:sodium- and chloride-dependent taurine transporter-like [Ylistrum balloti]|uniref:sodium- and chloride-dependent taurine transporter-like n=1 Tax=Ylistrum balloti TaxID=509963 RepID=UPI002905C8DE|nr:sodium- and chloride-dependent taurine transporter-like [Ylistrum balloti]
MSSKEKEIVSGTSNTEEAADDGKALNKRETWSTKLDFLLACIGFSVGLGNVWRFPYLCYKNGGGAFLIPYLICVVVGGIPLFYLEVAVGQFMGTSGLGAWNICPLLQGLGISTTIIVFFLNCYYNVILCWAFYYMFSSFALELPWATCNNWWNTDRCSTFSGKTDTNVTISNITSNVTVSGLKKLDAVTEFWERKVLAISDGIEHMGPVKWDLALTLLFAWIVVYLCICKGIRSSGKVMYVTATSPYLFMTALLIRNSLLDGAIDGVEFYLKPNITKLSEIEVWVDAGTQIFFSYSIAIGALTALGSYNLFNHNSYRDAIIFALANSGTSIFAGFLIFTILGHMAFLQETTVDKVAASGPGLAFIAYPKAVSLMPGAPVWSVLFFLMVILLGLDSQFVGVEGVVTAIVDQWPNYLRKGYRKEVFIGCVCAVSYLVGLSMVTEGGMYVFQLFDYYSGSRIILFVAFFECVAVAWIYGIKRFYDNIEMMMGFRINPFMGICWTVLSPIFCMSIFVMSAINYAELDYRRPDSTYVYPQWAVGIGWTMAAFAAVWIPLTALFKLYIYSRDHPISEVARRMLKPCGLRPHQFRSQDRGEESLVEYWTEKDLRTLDGRQEPPKSKEVPMQYTDQKQDPNFNGRSAGHQNPTFSDERGATFTKL